ncbi:TlpA family protein disulfide reductase [Halococcoides cellulosivorans]|uniref:Thioredoxin domain-containing protein n=1 Tax=Halococcoides cellulosivorans TaxID=1679096 RepID=A0A2R4WY94_9EURY|nr:hypothetical protein [Halococcoides cellulosivorans]AWB26519.1 hypothetical protein HARCEL1_01725 [Halococcoides cellulosivorans]
MHDERDLTRRRTLIGAGATSASLLAGCLGRGEESTGEDRTTDGTETATTGDGTSATTAAPTTETPLECRGDPTLPADAESAENGAADGSTDADWQEMELTSVRCADPFTIGSLDPPVVVETFAVWCPTCSAQQQNMRDLEGVTRVSLNVDPNESRDIVREHAAGNGFDWRYAIAPEPMTSALIDAFDGAIVHPPSTPIVVVCADGSTIYRSGSLKSADEIESLAAEC